MQHAEGEQSKIIGNTFEEAFGQKQNITELKEKIFNKTGLNTTKEYMKMEQKWKDLVIEELFDGNDEGD